MSNEMHEVDEMLRKAAVEGLLRSVLIKHKPSDARDFGKAIGEALLGPFMGDLTSFVRSQVIPKDPALDEIKIGGVTFPRDELGDVAAVEMSFYIGITSMLMCLTSLAEQGRSCEKPMEFLIESMAGIVDAWVAQKYNLLDEFDNYGKEYAAMKKKRDDLASKLSDSSLQPPSANLQ